MFFPMELPSSGFSETLLVLRCFACLMQLHISINAVLKSVGPQVTGRYRFFYRFYVEVASLCYSIEGKLLHP